MCFSLQSIFEGGFGLVQMAMQCYGKRSGFDKTHRVKKFAIFGERPVLHFRQVRRKPFQRRWLRLSPKKTFGRRAGKKT